MTRIEVERVYDVPSWEDRDGSIWHKHLHALHFCGQSGWAVGSDQILFSEDGGKSWVNQMTKQMDLGLNIPKTVFAINQQTAWITMVAHRAIRNCFYTRDGGKEWREKRLSNMLHPDDVFFFDQKLGWIISDDGDIPAGEAMIFKTSDGGRTWVSRQLEVKGAAEKLKFITPQKGLLIQHTTNEDRTRTVCNILVSYDGGHSWRVLRAFNRMIRDLCAADEDTFFVVGEGGFIARTRDGGITWKRSYTRSNDCLNVIEFNRHGRGIAGGDFGLILVTEDAGKHWTRYNPHAPLDNVVDASFLDPDHAVLATSTAVFSVRFN